MFRFVKSLFLPAKRDEPLRTAPTGVSPPARPTTWFFLCNRGSLNVPCFSLKFPDCSVMFSGLQGQPNLLLLYQIRDSLLRKIYYLLLKLHTRIWSYTSYIFDWSLVSLKISASFKLRMEKGLYYLSSPILNSKVFDISKILLKLICTLNLSIYV